MQLHQHRILPTQLDVLEMRAVHAAHPSNYLDELLDHTEHVSFSLSL